MATFVPFERYVLPGNASEWPSDGSKVFSLIGGNN